jgi:hypothetical protein
VEVVDWDGDVVSWVEEGGIGVIAFDERIGRNCVSLKQFSAMDFIFEKSKVRFQGGVPITFTRRSIALRDSAAKVVLASARSAVKALSLPTIFEASIGMEFGLSKLKRLESSHCISSRTFISENQNISSELTAFRQLRCSLQFHSMRGKLTNFISLKKPQQSDNSLPNSLRGQSLYTSIVPSRAYRIIIKLLKRKHAHHYPRSQMQKVLGWP